MKQRTFAIIKPDAVRKKAIPSILMMAHEYGLDPVAMLMTEMTEAFWREMYGAHDGKEFFEPLIEFMTSGEVVLLILEGEEAVQNWRKCMGATNPEVAAHGTIRHRHGTAGPANATHGSDSQEEAIAEVALVNKHGLAFGFPNDELGLSGMVD